MTTRSQGNAKAISPQHVRDLLIREKVIEDTSWSLDAPLISSGKMDSLDLVKMIAIFEEEYGVQLPDEALVQSNFETCTSIAATLRTV